MNLKPPCEPTTSLNYRMRSCFKKTQKLHMLLFLFFDLLRTSKIGLSYSHLFKNSSVFSVIVSVLLVFLAQTTEGPNILKLKQL